MGLNIKENNFLIINNYTADFYEKTKEIELEQRFALLYCE